MSANEVIKITVIHKEETVLVDVTEFSLYQGGRTLRKQKLEIYQESFNLSDCISQ